MATLVAFLGTGDYEPVHYELDGKKTAAPEAFTQAALVELLDLRVVVLIVTAAAKTTNFERLRARLGQIGIADCDIRTVDIPDGVIETEIWTIFEQLGELPAGDIVFDATHGFRALPLIASLAMPFHADRGGFHVERVVYGSFEKLGKLAIVKKRREGTGAYETAPFIDLTVMMDLPLWTTAIAEWKRDGRAHGLEERLRGPVERLGKMLAKSAPPELRRLPDRLARLSDAVSVVKFDDVPTLAAEVLAVLASVAGQITAHDAVASLRPFIPIIQDLRASIEPLALGADGAMGAALRLATWYLERERYSACYTTLRELTTDAIVCVANMSGLPEIRGANGESSLPTSRAFREAVDGSARAHVTKNSRRHDQRADQDAAIERLKRYLDANPPLCRALQAVEGMSDRRNKLNHAFKGDFAGEKLARNRQSNRLPLHAEAAADIQLVADLLAAVESARACAPPAPS